MVHIPESVEKAKADGMYPGFFPVVVLNSYFIKEFGRF